MKCQKPDCGIINNKQSTECVLCSTPLRNNKVKKEEKLISTCCNADIRYSKGSYMGEHHEVCSRCGNYCNVVQSN